MEERAACQDTDMKERAACQEMYRHERAFYLTCNRVFTWYNSIVLKHGKGGMMPRRQQAVRVTPPPLPATKQDLLAIRKHSHEPSLIDECQEVHELVWEDQDYQPYWLAFQNDQAITGSVLWDEVHIVQKIK